MPPVVMVIPLCKDANDFFRDHDGEAFKKLIGQARLIEVASTKERVTQENLENGFVLEL
jgi:hypothetical protein